MLSKIIGTVWHARDENNNDIVHMHDSQFRTLISHIESLSQKHEALVAECKAWRTDPELQGYESAATRKARAHTDSISALERSEG